MEGDQSVGLETLDRRTEVAVVGAGVAGTALALALKQAGLCVRIYDRDAERPPRTAMVELTANGSRVLHALGLKPALLEVAAVPDFATIRSATTGFLLAQRPLGRFSDARYGAPCYLIDGTALTGMLRLACADAGIPIERDSEITDVETHSATLVTSGGARYRHLGAAIASGHTGFSDRLSELLENRERETAPYAAIRARVPRPEPRRDHHRFVNTWLFAGGYCVERPVPEAAGDRQHVELLLVIRDPEDEASPSAALTRILGSAHSALASLVPGKVEAERLDAPLVAPADHWHAGRTALLGAVCHAPPAYAGWGSTAALEDAWVLSRMMERSEEEPHLELAEYERFRKPRAWRLRAHANAELDIFTLSRPGAIWRRNLGWSLTSRFLPEIAMEKLDWLYGYDCIKGFA